MSSIDLPCQTYKKPQKIYECILQLQNIAYLQCTRWTYNIDSAHDTKTVRHTDI